MTSPNTVESQQSEQEQVEIFGPEDLKRNAVAYAKHKALVNAVSKYDSLDDAIGLVTEVWEALRKQVEDGAAYTPSADLGFGSNNAAQIAEAIMGLTTGVPAIRKALTDMGK